MNTIILAIILMAGTGLVLGVVIGIFAKLFRVESDPRVDLVTELLPGANCGGCGTAGCSDFAKAVVSGQLPPSKCPVSSSEQVSAIARALGIEAGESFKQKAVVLCGGDREQTMRLASYNGVADCVSASLVAGGPKGCSYGCLGMGSCARKCPFGAIEMINGLAVIHRELCVGCGTCVAVCPRNVIKLVPADAEVHVYCNSSARKPPLTNSSSRGSRRRSITPIPRCRLRRMCRLRVVRPERCSLPKSISALKSTIRNGALRNEQEFP